ncbi:hypothetical protein PIB30_106855 [Stylosanthes scabra]|uniref:RNase H type-1 domain-containing protein n=1 Tax=Stylosanthes scabra TaxID=79078 RepID=A0ABU6ZXI9_9FABA|nr:hypothetical protein [Stylosanthes scabra]
MILAIPRVGVEMSMILIFIPLGMSMLGFVNVNFNGMRMAIGYGFDVSVFRRRDCSRARNVWQHLKLSHNRVNFCSWIMLGMKNNAYLFFVRVWWLWRDRNNDVFNNLDENVLCDIEKTPGFGCVIRNLDDTWIRGCSDSIPYANVLCCEVFSIWRGLVLTWEADFHNILCETDCLEVYSLIYDNYSTRSCNVVDLFDKVRDILRWRWNAKVILIQRSADNAADTVTRVVAHSESSHVKIIQPSLELCAIMQQDLSSS